MLWKRNLHVCECEYVFFLLQALLTEKRIDTCMKCLEIYFTQVLPKTVC